MCDCSHLVVAGGGPLGLRYFGVLNTLRVNGGLQIDSIKSMYATSIGGIVCVLAYLAGDNETRWQETENYLINRPWQKVFGVSGHRFMQAFSKCGVFDEQLIRDIMEPILNSHGLCTDITLHQLDEWKKQQNKNNNETTSFVLVTCEVNSMQTVYVSKDTHPSLPLIKALTMSCSIPGLFSPVYWEGKCYVDGGVLCNVPLQESLNQQQQQKKKKEKTLLIYSSVHYQSTATTATTTHEEMNMVEFMTVFMSNWFANQLRQQNQFENTEQSLLKIVNCSIDVPSSVLSIHVWLTLLETKEKRRQWVQDYGKVDCGKLLISS